MITIHHQPPPTGFKKSSTVAPACLARSAAASARPGSGAAREDGAPVKPASSSLLCQRGGSVVTEKKVRWQQPHAHAPPFCQQRTPRRSRTGRRTSRTSLQQAVPHLEWGLQGARLLVLKRPGHRVPRRKRRLRLLGHLLDPHAQGLKRRAVLQSADWARHSATAGSADGATGSQRQRRACERGKETGHKAGLRPRLGAVAAALAGDLSEKFGKAPDLGIHAEVGPDPLRRRQGVRPGCACLVRVPCSVAQRHVYCKGLFAPGGWTRCQSSSRSMAAPRAVGRRGCCRRLRLLRRYSRC